jgi:hypothetical protein
MKVINQGINILINPKEAFSKLKNENFTKQDLIIYLAILSLPILIGIIVGYAVVGFGGSIYGVGWSYKFPIGHAITAGVVHYILMIIGIIGFGYVFNMFAPTFKSKQNLMQALKLTTFAATPVLLAGIFYIYPPISLLVLVFALYSLYLLYIGIPMFMETPEDNRIPYLIISIIIFIVIIFIISYIVGSIMWAAVGGYPTTGYVRF